MANLLRRAGALIDRIIASAADPVAVAGSILKYAKTVGTIVQEYAIDSSSNVFQLTPPGVQGGIVISPAAITGATADYAPTGLRNATIIRQALSGAATISGLDATVAGTTNRRVTIINIDAALNLTISNEGLGSVGANRFALPGAVDYTLNPGAAASFEYDTTSQRWRAIGLAITGSGGAALNVANAWTKAQNVSTVNLVDAPSIDTDASLSNVFAVTLTNNRTLANPTNLVNGGVYTWIITQDAIGTHTLAYGNLFKWTGGTPVLSLAGNAIDTITAIYNGTVLLASFQKTYV